MERMRTAVGIFAAVFASLLLQAAGPAQGPLRVHTANPRYFTHDGARAVLLVGSHTWGNFQEYRPADDRSGTFPYRRYLDFLRKHNHNFIRMWTWENSLAEGGSSEINRHRAHPLPYARTGPGDANDGEPRFDLSRFNQAFFDRLRSRAIAARANGIYMSVMLFEGWSVRNFIKGRQVFPYHPFHRGNNVNGIDGDPNGSGEGEEVHTLEIPAVTRLQEAYIRKVVDTVNDLDNVLYEVSNESLLPMTKHWQYHIIRYLKEYQASKPKQHPVGMTGHTGLNNSILLDSTADWISPGTTRYPNRTNEMVTSPPAASGRKVLIHDTDHLGAESFVTEAAFSRGWVWKSFTRGYNPILMELHMTDPMGDLRPGLVAARKAMGDARHFADKMNLAAMTPQDQLASSGYCLAEIGKEYLAYLPDGGALTLDLTAVAGTVMLEWFDPVSGRLVKAAPILGGACRTLTSPFGTDSVLHAKKARF